MIKDTTWGRRLIMERDRLGYSKMESFAQATDVSARTLYNYASEDTQLSVEFLIRFAQLGGDVQFVITGIRSKNLVDVKQAVQDDRAYQLVVLRQLQELTQLLSESIQKAER